MGGWISSVFSRLAVEDLSINFSDEVDLFLDGRNYVRCDDKVVMTDKIFAAPQLEALGFA